MEHRPRALVVEATGSRRPSPLDCPAKHVSLTPSKEAASRVSCEIVSNRLPTRTCALGDGEMLVSTKGAFLSPWRWLI